MGSAVVNRPCPNAQCAMWGKADKGNIRLHGFLKLKRGCRLKARSSPLPRSADCTIVTRARRERVASHCRPHLASPGLRLQLLLVYLNRLPNPSTTTDAPAQAPDWPRDQSRPAVDSGPHGVFGKDSRHEG